MSHVSRDQELISGVVDFFDSTSLHLVFLVLNVLEGTSAELISCLAVEDLVDPAVALGEHAQLQLLLLLLHLVLRLEQQLGDQRKSLFDSLFTEVALLDFISGQLTATARCAPVVLEACSCGLNHPKGCALHDVVGCHNH